MSALGSLRVASPGYAADLPCIYRGDAELKWCRRFADLLRVGDGLIGPDVAEQAAIEEFRKAEGCLTTPEDAVLAYLGLDLWCDTRPSDLER